MTDIHQPLFINDQGAGPSASRPGQHWIGQVAVLHDGTG